MDRRSFVTAGTALVACAAEIKGDEANQNVSRPEKLKLRYAINIDTHFNSHPVSERLRALRMPASTAIEFNSLPNLGAHRA